jgi:hypothetical protein
VFDAFHLLQLTHLSCFNELARENPSFFHVTLAKMATIEGNANDLVINDVADEQFSQRVR